MAIKVLIVDDTRTIRFQLREMLGGRDFEVDEAGDGMEALERIRADKPHIVLMDIMMPNMDGIECCRRIKNDKSSKDIKVIMVSTKDEYPKITEAFKARCDDYITKPIKKIELLNKIDDLSKMVKAKMTLKSLGETTYI